LESLQRQAEEVIDKARKEASAAIQAQKKASEDDIQKAAEEHKKVGGGFLWFLVFGVGGSVWVRLGAQHRDPQGGGASEGWGWMAGFEGPLVP